MSKRLTRLALIAILVMALSGSAFAEDRTWVVVGGTGDWGTAANWNDGTTKGIPTSADRAVFPNSAVKVNITGPQEVGAILIDSGANNVEFNLTTANARLFIDQTKIGSDDMIAIPGIQAKGNATFTGQGQLVLRSGAVTGSTLDTLLADGAFLFDVFKDANLNIGVVTSADAAVLWAIKANKGTLEFSANQDNTLGATVARFEVRDGELAIARPNHISDLTTIDLNDMGIQERSVTLTTTWTNSRAFNKTAKVQTLTNATLNVREEGSTLELAISDDVVRPTANTTLTKVGPGALLMSVAGVWDDVRSTLDITEGSVVLGASTAIGGIDNVNVKVGADTEFRLNKIISDDIRNLTGSGTLNLLEGSYLTMNGPASAFSGKITGAGSIRIGEPVTHAVATISGTENDYTGDTFVGVGSKLAINHAANLGGANKWSTGKIYLDALATQATVANVNTDPVTFATLEIADGANFTIPNEIFVGDSLRDISDANANVGGAVIHVPVNTQLTATNNITYNRNVLVKAGEGDLILEGLGYDSIGGGQFAVTGGGMTGGATADPVISTALHILNGRISIENGQAAGNGDIVVDSGASNAMRPILSIRNGIKMINSIMFTAQSTFATELIDANLADGTDVQSAVEVGYVYYNRAFLNGNRTTGNYSGLVYNRINFSELQAGTIEKGNRFQLMKSHNFVNYSANNIEPTYWDGMGKAPFDPYISTVYLYFDALKTIDVPVIGEPSVTGLRPSTAYSFTIPVTAKSGLKAGSQAVFTTPASDALAYIDGTNLNIRGTAPAGGDVTFRVTVTSAGDVYNDILEYVGERSFTLSVTSGDIPPAEKTLQEKIDAMSDADKAKFTVGANPIVVTTLNASYQDSMTTTMGTSVSYPVVFLKKDANNNWTVDNAYDGAEQTAYLYAGKLTLAEVKTAFGNAAATAKATPASGQATFTFTPAAAGRAADVFANGDYTMAVQAANGDVIGGSMNAVVNVSDGGNNEGGSGSSGCDAGFGAFALLALGAAVALRTKD